MQKPQKETWRQLVKAYRGSAGFRKLAPRTQKSYNDTIEWILSNNADKSVTTLTKQRLRDLHVKFGETPRKADMLVQMVSILTNFAGNQLDWVISNPTEGLTLYGKQREYEPWPDWMGKNLADAPAIVRSAAELILGTGQRPAAAIAMRRDQFQGEWMMVTDEKGDESYEIFHPTELRSYVQSLPVTGIHILSRNLTQPMRYDTVEKSFRAWRTELGERAKPYSLHGLRKLAIIRLAEAGCTDAEIQAVTNQSAQTAAYYRKRANRKKTIQGGDGTERGQNMKVGTHSGKRFADGAAPQRNPLILWCRLQESNPRPSDYKSAALPAELNRQSSCSDSVWKTQAQAWLRFHEVVIAHSPINTAISSGQALPPAAEHSVIFCPGIIEIHIGPSEPN